MSKKNPQPVDLKQQQLEQVSMALLNYKEAAYQNEIILNRTLRFVTGKLLQLIDSTNLKDDIYALIAELNKVEVVKKENEQRETN